MTAPLEAKTLGKQDHPFSRCSTLLVEVRVPFLFQGAFAPHKTLNLLLPLLIWREIVLPLLSRPRPVRNCTAAIAAPCLVRNGTAPFARHFPAPNGSAALAARCSAQSGSAIFARPCLARNCAAALFAFCPTRNGAAALARPCPARVGALALFAHCPAQINAAAARVFPSAAQR